MTQIKVLKDINTVVEVNVEGHAFYADSGNDIVCSAISILCYAIGNQMLLIDENNINIEIDEGKFNIVSKKYNKDINLLFETLINGFKMINENYPNNLKIQEV